MRVRYPEGVPKRFVRRLRKELAAEKRKRIDEGIRGLVAKLSPRTEPLPSERREALLRVLERFSKMKPFCVIAIDLAQHLEFLYVGDEDRTSPFRDIINARILEVTDLRKFCRKLKAAIPKPPRCVLEEKTP